MPLSPGSKLGPYEVIAPLGAGGMGEVYRARDTRLGRDVAIKVLPAHLSARPEIRARFEREAKTISSLNHPNICALYDVGRAPGEAGSGDVDFLVMELVEGETLAQRLEKGTLPVAEVMKIGAQVADALDRAHRAGVVHRDLKPGNVMLTRAGAKLMDFGLARATGMAGPAGASGVTMAALSQSPTVAQPLTAEGTIVGTFQYMAPEQLEGREADARADIWAFGCVLYEMATGRRAFDGQSQASLIGSIMKDEPRPLSEVAPLAPPALDRVVKRCLAKDPDDRWQSAADIKHELHWITESSSQSGVAAPVAATRRKRLGALGGIALGIVIAAVPLLLVFQPWRAKPVSAPPLVRFTFRAPNGQTLSAPAEATLSPDGRMIAFVTFDSAGRRIYTRSFDQLEARRVSGTEGGSLPFWSPDGRTLGFFSQGKLRKVALDGSASLELCDAPDGRGGSWAPNGTILFAPNNQGGILRVSAGGGTPVVVTTIDSTRGERGHRYPQFLPDGKHFLYVAVGAGETQPTYVALVDGGRPEKVNEAGSGAVYSAPGYLLFLDAGVNALRRRLLSRHFDANARKASGDAVVVLDDVNATNFGYTNATTSPQGTMVVQHWGDVHTALRWLDRRGKVAGVVSEDLSNGLEVALSPDQQTLAYDGARPADVFSLDIESGVSARLTFKENQVSNFRWSPDGKRITFARLLGAGRWDTYVKNADGTGPDSLLVQGPGLFAFPMGWSPNGRWLMLSVSDVGGSFSFWKLDLEGSGKPELYETTTAGTVTARFSPDGRWVATITTESDGKNALFVQSFPVPGARYQVAVNDPQSAFWNPRGGELIVSESGGRVVSVPVSTEAGFRQGAVTPLFRLNRSTFVQGVSADGQRLLVTEVLDVSNLITLEVVMGWEGLMRGR
jgi:eukaryotic-like serine/threonine-protein kinase